MLEMKKWHKWGEGNVFSRLSNLSNNGAIHWDKNGGGDQGVAGDKGRVWFGLDMLNLK